jgi:hypothetical protein
LDPPPESLLLSAVAIDGVIATLRRRFVAMNRQPVVTTSGLSRLYLFGERLNKGRRSLLRYIVTLPRKLRLSRLDVRAWQEVLSRV